MKINKKGFSFIELIVVITIIAVLSVAAIVSYGPVQKKSRDSRRVADLEKISMALEIYRQVGTTYPAASSGVPIGLTPTYLQTYPTDPKGVNLYFYTRDVTSNYKYTLDAVMEDVGSTNCPTTCGAYNYRVISP